MQWWRKREELYLFQELLSEVEVVGPKVLHTNTQEGHV
jgi:hypothetical protein